MTTLTIFDLEGDGLYEECTQVWCGCTTNFTGTERQQFNPDNIGGFIEVLKSSDIIVCHNLFDYDLRVLEKLYDFKYEGIAVDTLVMSRLLRPPELGGRYGLEEWGELFRVPKPKHEDWSRFSPEMLHRCTEDVEINRRALSYLLRYSGLTVSDLLKLPRY